MKVIFERAKILILLLIFPKRVKSLQVQTLRHFYRASNINFSKLSLAEASKWREKETPRQAYFVGHFILETSACQLKLRHSVILLLAYTESGLAPVASFDVWLRTDFIFFQRQGEDPICQQVYFCMLLNELQRGSLPQRIDKLLYLLEIQLYFWQPVLPCFEINIIIQFILLNVNSICHVSRYKKIRLTLENNTNASHASVYSQSLLHE